MSRLPDVCDLQYGFAFNADLFTTDVSKGMPLVRIRDVVRGFSETYTLEPFPENYLVHDGDILIGMDGEFNIARWHGGTAALNQRVCKLTPHENIHDQYLLYFLPKALKRIEDATPFVTVKHLSAKKLNAIEIPDVPMAVQKKMAAKMDEISAAMANRKKVIAWLEKIVQARFVEMFGDPVTNPKKWDKHFLRDDIQFLTSGSRGWAKYFSEDGEMFITITNVKNGCISLDSVQHIHAPNNAEARRTRVQTGDLLISITADLGRTGVVTKEIAKHGAYINQHLTCIRLNQAHVLPEYVSAFLESDAGKLQFQAKNQTGVKAGLNFDAIKGLEILVPPIDLQREYISFLQQASCTKNATEAQFSALAMLRAKVLQDAFGA